MSLLTPWVHYDLYDYDNIITRGRRLEPDGFGKLERNPGDTPAFLDAWHR